MQGEGDEGMVVVIKRTGAMREGVGRERRGRPVRMLMSDNLSKSRRRKMWRDELSGSIYDEDEDQQQQQQQRIS